MLHAWRIGHRLGSLALATGLVFGCAGGVEDSDVLIVTIDTARADRFSYAGDSPVATPNIDALAAEGTVFLDAVAPAPLTLVSHASLFTGLQPPAHGVRNNGSYRLPRSVTTIAELLNERGYRTGAFVAAAVLDSKYGLDQGFDHYDDAVYEDRLHPERRGEEVVRAALGWLDGNTDERTFVWVHLFDPHDPYRPPEPERSRYPDSRYDGEIAYVDRLVGELLDGYRQRDRYRRLVVALTADHGESLGEHGEDSHGVFVYDATIKVPFLVRAPGVGAGRRVETQVQLVDLLPTLGDLLQLEAPPGVRGRSLVPAMRGGELEAVPAYSESFLPRENYGWSEVKGLRLDGWKLVLGVEPELYDLRRDARELRDVAVDHPRRVARMRRLLEAELAAAGRFAVERLEMDDETRRHLEALGYLSTGPRRSRAGEPETAEALPDPRQQIHLSRAHSRALELFDRGFHETAISRARTILEADPGNILVRRLLAVMLLATGRFEEGGEQLMELVERSPETGWVWKFVGVWNERVGRPGEAVAAYERAYRADPSELDARYRAWELQLAAGEREAVLAAAEAALAADPADSGAQVFRAIARWRGHEPDRLVAELEAVDQQTPGDAEILAALGEAHHERGDLQRALPLLSRAQSLIPDADRHAVRLVRTLAALGRSQGIWQVLHNLRKRGMLDPEVWLLLGAACAELGDGPCAARSLARAAALVEGPLRPWLARLPHPQVADGWEERAARLLALAGRMDEADSVWRVRASTDGNASGYRELLELDADRRQAALDAARSDLARGRPEAARRALEASLRAYPLDLEIALAYAELCARLGDDSALREVLTSLAERLVSGEGPPVWSGSAERTRLVATAALTRAGGASWQRGGYANAWHAYFLGALLVPDDPRTQYNLGLAWERLGDHREALRAFDRTLAMSPDFPRAREHRLAAAHAVGRGEGGRVSD